jgi:integrase
MPQSGQSSSDARALSEEDERVKALTENELRRLLAEIPAPWRLFFELLAQTDLRIGEAVALRWSDVDWSTSRLNVRRRFYRDTFAPPKSQYGRRAIPLGRHLRAELELRFPPR